MSAHVGRCVRACGLDPELPHSRIGEYASHQPSCKVFAAMGRFGLDMRNSHHAVFDSVGG